MHLQANFDTPQNTFAQTVTDVRKLTSLPVWIAETGTNPGPAVGPLS